MRAASPKVKNNIAPAIQKRDYENAANEVCKRENIGHKKNCDSQGNIFFLYQIKMLLLENSVNENLLSKKSCIKAALE